MAGLVSAWERAQAGQPQLFVLWGRRRVGKTFLLSHFVQGRRAVFFGATEQAEGVQLQRLAAAVRRDLGDRVADLAGGRFDSWEAALRFFAALSAGEPLAVVLDEVPYLTRSTPGFASVVQVVWDHLSPGSRLLLILTGSAIGVMEALLGAGGALRGRPTTSLRMEPLDLLDARDFLPELPGEDLLQAYAACGGYPLHLLGWDSRRPIEENLLALAFTPGGILLEDAGGMLREELSPAGGYAQILAAIGRGRTRFSQIAAEVAQRIDYALEVLNRSGFVAKSLPVGAPRGARPTYELPDPYLQFWFSVLYSDLTFIEGGQGRAVLERTRPRWQTHVGRVFEEACRRHARRLVRGGELPSDLVIGRWWSSRGQPVEVDVLGLRQSRAHLIGEARWQSGPVGRRDLEGLRRKMTLIPHLADEPVLAFWARGGVTDEVHRQDVLGFSVEDVVR